MIVLMWAQDKNEDNCWLEFDIDKHAISGYWNIPFEVAEDIIIPSDEYNVLIDGNIITIKEDLNLLAFLNHKFKK